MCLEDLAVVQSSRRSNVVTTATDRAQQRPQGWLGLSAGQLTVSRGWLGQLNIVLSCLAAPHSDCRGPHAGSLVSDTPWHQADKPQDSRTCKLLSWHGLHTGSCWSGRQEAGVRARAWPDWQQEPRQLPGSCTRGTLIVDPVTACKACDALSAPVQALQLQATSTNGMKHISLSFKADILTCLPAVHGQAAQQRVLSNLQASGLRCCASPRLGQISQGHGFVGRLSRKA